MGKPPPRLSSPAEALSEYCEDLSRVYTNGFVESRMYSVAESIAQEVVFAYKRYPHNPCQFLEIFRHLKIKEDFQIGETDEKCLIQRANWTHYSPFLFAGYLAKTLAHGGAYVSLMRSAGEIGRCVALSEEVFRVFNRNHLNFNLHICNKPWCSRFYNIVWDHTWVILDPELRHLTILIASDTD